MSVDEKIIRDHSVHPCVLIRRDKCNHGPTEPKIFSNDHEIKNAIQNGRRVKNAQKLVNMQANFISFFFKESRDIFCVPCFLSSIVSLKASAFASSPMAAI